MGSFIQIGLMTHSDRVNEAKVTCLPFGGKRFLSGGVADTTEVAYAFGNSHEGVAHVLLVL